MFLLHTLFISYIKNKNNIIQVMIYKKQLKYILLHLMLSKVLCISISATFSSNTE